MNNQIRRASLVIAGIAIMAGMSMLSCKKEPGPKGDTGPAGPAGAPGNANVKTVTLFIPASDWVNTAGYSYVTKLVPEITADIISKGVVMVYVEDTPGVWYALPLADADKTGTVITLGFAIENGKLTLEMTFNANVTLTSADIGNNNFRVAIIAGSALAKNPNLDLTDISQLEGLVN